MVKGTRTISKLYDAAFCLAASVVAFATADLAMGKRGRSERRKDLEKKEVDKRESNRKEEEGGITEARR